VGERWALLVVRELVMGPRRFNDLQKTLPRIRPNVLTGRLRELEASGVLRRIWLGAPTSAWVYELTDWGRELKSVLIQLARWNLRSPSPLPHAPVSTISIMLALQSRFDPVYLEDIVACVMIELESQQFVLHVDHGQLDISHGNPADVDAILRTDQETLRDLVTNAHPLEQAEHKGRAHVAGDREVVTRILGAVTRK
jgi:DNA-binding HxlR family transcriptional regulator